MDNLLSGLSLMFFDLTIVDKMNNDNPILVFSVACSIIGAFAVLLDLTIYFLRGKSPLQLKHGKNTILFLIAWAFGALVLGWIGQMARIFVVSVAASVLVGFTWPLIFTKYLRDKAEEEKSSEPEQEIMEEV